MSAWYSCSRAQQYLPTAYRISCVNTSCPALAHPIQEEEEEEEEKEEEEAKEKGEEEEEEEEEEEKLWPASLMARDRASAMPPSVYHLCQTKCHGPSRHTCSVLKPKQRQVYIISCNRTSLSAKANHSLHSIISESLPHDDDHMCIVADMTKTPSWMSHVCP